MLELIFCRRSIDIVSNIVREANHEHVGLGNAVSIQEDVRDMSSVEVIEPLLEVARLLGDCVGSDSVKSGSDPTTDSIHEEISTGRW